MYLQKYFTNTISNDDCKEHKALLKFCPLSVLTYTHFTNINIDSGGIPKLCNYFLKFNPIVLLTEDLMRFDLKVTPTDVNTLKWQMDYVYKYISDTEFKKTPKTTDYDHIVYSIFAYIFLNLSIPDLYTFQQTYPNIYHLCKELVQIYNDQHIVIIRGLPFTGATFRIINRHLQQDYDDDQMFMAVKEDFSIKQFITTDHISHFQDVYTKLCNESWYPNEEKLLHQFENYGLLHPIINQMQQVLQNRTTRPKYITGMACCGKTTFLQTLSKNGWLIKSRGDMGAFGGKSKSPAQMAALHASMDFILRKFSTSVIGDRGPIDNPLWNVIMPLCSPKYKSRMVEEILMFFDTTINETSIGYFSEFDTVIFLDMYPSRNRKRMIARSTGGDAYRGRLPMYAIAQFMAYYIFATLFGYNIITVPYDESKEFNLQQAMGISQFLSDYFGKPQQLTEEQMSILNVKHVGKNVRAILSDFDYPQLTCIMK